MIHYPIHIPEDVDLSRFPSTKKFLSHAKGLEHDVSLQLLAVVLKFATS